MDWMLMPLRRYAEFSGRSRRKEYWMFALLNLLVSVFIGLVALVLYTLDWSEEAMMTVMAPLMVAGVIYSVIALVPGIAVTIRRLHDTDRSGWNILWGLVPVIGGFILLYFYVTEGTPGPNRFGADPKGRADTAAFA